MLNDRLNIKGKHMQIQLTINGTLHNLDVLPGTTLFAVLRGLGLQGVKFGDEGGLSGADTVLLDGRPINAGSLLAAQAQGHRVATIEALGEHPEQGWKKSGGLHPLQQAFVDTGAIQCGYCTPAQILAAQALLQKNSNPSEDEVREAISGVLCRCTGYLKPVQAILRAAAILRGDEPVNWDSINWDLGGREDNPPAEEHPSAPPFGETAGLMTRPKVVVTPEARTWRTVGKPEIKVDHKLVRKASLQLISKTRLAQCCIAARMRITPTPAKPRIRRIAC
jgi:putative selenate reductase molybdopterin-binding subunit